MARKPKIKIWILLALFMGIFLSISGAYFGLRWIARNRDPGPAVTIEEVAPEEPAIVGQSVVVRGRAVHPDGVERTELWINGQKVSAQPVEGGSNTVAIHVAWLPGAEGYYNVVLKATSVHGISASSSPRLMRAEVQEEVEDSDVRTQIFFRDGDTLQSVAEELGVEPADIELLEGASEPVPGSYGYVRGLAEEAAEEGGALEEEDVGTDLPPIEPVEPIEDPVPTGGGDSGVPFWAGMPGVDLICTALPEVCGGGPEAGLPAKPGDVINFELSGRCQVVVQWTDRSDNETGFRIFRVEPGVTTGLELVGEVPFSPGAGNHRSFLDDFAGRGRFTYIVQAYNGAGNAYMPASGEVETRCDETYRGEKVPLVVEAVSLESDASRNKIYCYVGLGRGYLERVPGSYGEFIERQADGTWNIAEHFAGDNRRRVWADREENLIIRGRCDVRESYMPLSSFSASIPPEHWDGREIVVGPEDGSYQATVRVFFTTESGGGDPLVDPDIPPPNNLKEVDHWQRCGFLGSCLTFPGPAIAWEYPTGLGVSEPRAYRVFRQVPGESEVEQVHRSRHPSWSAPMSLGSSGCQLGATYSVNAVTDIRDPITGDFIESPPSEEFEVNSECVTIEITLEELIVEKIRDHCPGIRCTNSGGVYGTLWIGDQDVTWNFHCHKNCIRGGLPKATKVNVYEDPYYWRDFYLDYGEGFDTENNTFFVQFPAGEGLRFNWEFKEHDRRNDDNWCANRDRSAVLSARSRSAWQELDELLTLSGDDGDCEVSFRVRGVSE